MGTEHHSRTVSLGSVYRAYEYLILGGLVATVLGAVACKLLNVTLSPSEATWVTRGLFIVCFFGSFYMVRQPEILYEVEREWSERRRKLLILKTTVGFMPSGILIVSFKELLAQNPQGAVIAAGLLCFVWGYTLYHRSLANGEITQPALAYWGVISFIDLVSFGASLKATGWSIGTFQLLCWTLGAGSVLTAIVWRSRFSLTWRPTRTDTFCTLVSAIAMLVWFVGSPTLALAALAIAMAAACFPLVLSAAQGNEAALPLAPFALGGLTGLFSVEHWGRWDGWVMPMLGAVSFGGAFLLAAAAKKPHIS